MGLNRSGPDRRVSLASTGWTMDKGFQATHIMLADLWPGIAQQRVLHGVSLSDDLRVPFLSFGGEHGRSGEEASVREVEFEKSVGGVASAKWDVSKSPNLVHYRDPTPCLSRGSTPVEGQDKTRVLSQA